jgi:hypothetical protein
MPPQSLASALTLVGLSSLAAIEAGACEHRGDPLPAASRQSLALIQLSPAAAVTDRHLLGDYGLSAAPALAHLCGRYALADNGAVTSQDAFASPTDRATLSKQLGVSDERPSIRPVLDRSVTIELRDLSQLSSLPKNCASRLPPKTRTLVVASRTL